MPSSPTVLIPISEPIGGQMSAVGIRKLEIGKALAKYCDVTFACSASDNDAVEGARVVTCRTGGEFRRLLAGHDILYTLGVNADRFLTVGRSRICVILDLYTPLALEILESWPEVPTPLLKRLHRRIVRWSVAQLGLADFVVCASEIQRNFWLGMLNAMGKLDAGAVRGDPNCRNLIDVVPYGVPSEPPRRNGKPLRKRLPGRGTGEFVFLWSSKILAWQDPLTLLRAMCLIKDSHPDIKLVFLGIGDAPCPTPRSWFDPTAYRTRETLQIAHELGLTDKNVFFVHDRVPYRDVAAYYLDADAAVATYPNTLETHFCLGSRLLDYVWAELPIVVSGGLLQREFVEAQGIGIAVSPHNADALARALVEVRNRVRTGHSFSTNLRAARSRLCWSTVVQPIARFCLSGVNNYRWPKSPLWKQYLQFTEFVTRTAVCRLTQITSQKKETASH